MNFKIKTIIRYKEEILNLIPDKDNKSTARVIIDELVHSVLDVVEMNKQDSMNMILDGTIKRNNELINNGESKDDG